MFSGVKKAAAVLQSTASGHSALSMAIFNEKCHSEAIEKLISTRLDGNESMREWSNMESNAVLKELIKLMTETDQLWVELMQNYLGEYDAYRKTFKDILKGEKSLDEKKREVEAHSAKVAKLKKQLASTGRKSGDLSRVEALDVELAKAISVHENSEDEKRAYAANHERFKFVKVQEAWQLLCKSRKDFHTKCQKLVDAQTQVLNVCLHNSEQPYTEDAARIVHKDGSTVITRVAEALDLARPRLSSEIDAGATFQSHVSKRALLADNGDAGMADRRSMPLPPLPSDAQNEQRTVVQEKGGREDSVRRSNALPPLPSQEDDTYAERYDPPESTTYSETAEYDNSCEGLTYDEDYMALTDDSDIPQFPDESYLKMKRLSQSMPIGNTAHLWGKRTSFQENLQATDVEKAGIQTTTRDEQSFASQPPAADQQPTQPMMQTSESTKPPDDAYDNDEITT